MPRKRNLPRTDEEENPKHEILNSKQIQITKIQNSKPITGEVVCLYPVEVQNNVKGDKSDKYGSAGFVKKSEGITGEMLAKQYRCCLVDKKQKQNRI